MNNIIRLFSLIFLSSCIAKHQIDLCDSDKIREENQRKSSSYGEPKSWIIWLPNRDIN